MAYQEFTISALADIPAIVSTFAASMGWNVVSNVLRHPDYAGGGPGGPGFQLSSSLVGLNEDLIWTCTTGETTTTARIRSPILTTEATPSSPARRVPTKLFLIGMITPEPYIAIVVEYGYNLYRHLYLGYLEKQGDFEGGVCISGTCGPFTTSSGEFDFYGDDSQQYLFNANQKMWAANQSGGVLVIDADNPTAWRNFRSANPAQSNPVNLYLAFNGQEVLGGYKDSINDPYLGKAKAQMAGANVLVPINLVLTRMLTTDFRLKPIGIPTGVRLINVQEIEPQAAMEIGGDDWYSFAAARKSSATRYPRPTTNGNFYRTDETSFYIGYAYRG